MVTAWTELAKSLKTKSPSRCFEGSESFSVPTTRCPREVMPSLLSGTPRQTASVSLAETRQSRLDSGEDSGGVQKQKISKVSFGLMLSLGQRFGSAFVLLSPHLL